MWGAKKQRIAELEARVRQLADERDDARRDAETERFNNVTMARQVWEADAANKRLYGRNRHLTEQLEQAREAARDGALDEMGRRLDRALHVCARYLDAYHAQCRVNDRLSDQLMGAMGYTDAGLKALGVAVAEHAEERGEVKA